MALITGALALLYFRVSGSIESEHFLIAVIVQEQDDIHYVAVPVLFVIFFAYIVASVFFIVYEVII